MQPQQSFYVPPKDCTDGKEVGANADFVKLLANFRKRLIIMSDTEYPNAVGGF